jgi:putative Mg2+ transporter-C (MgtC) family protein
MLRKVSLARGYDIARGSLSITFREGQPEWHFLAVARDKRKGAESFQISPTRH